MKLPLSVDHFGYSGFLLALVLLLIPFSRVNLSVSLMSFFLHVLFVFSRMVEYSLDLQNMNFTAIRTVRVLRPLKAINRVPSKWRRHIGLCTALFTRLQGGCTNEMKYCTDKLIYSQFKQHDANTKPIIKKNEVGKTDIIHRQHSKSITKGGQRMLFYVQTVKPTEAMWLWFWDFIRETDLIWFECESALNKQYAQKNMDFTKNKLLP